MKNIKSLDRLLSKFKNYPTDTNRIPFTGTADQILDLDNNFFMVSDSNIAMSASNLLHLQP